MRFVAFCAVKDGLLQHKKPSIGNRLAARHLQAGLQPCQKQASCATARKPVSMGEKPGGHQKGVNRS